MRRYKVQRDALGGLRPFTSEADSEGLSTATLVSLEDGCINEFVQRGTRGSPDHEAFMEMGGRDVAPDVYVVKGMTRDPDLVNRSFDPVAEAGAASTLKLPPLASGTSQ